VFSPDLTFDQYYAVQCLEAADDLTALFTLLEDGKPSHLIRYEDMVSLAPQLKILKTTQTCLFCVRICPEYGLVCNHSLCYSCVCTFATRCFGMPHRFKLPQCLLCLAKVDFVAWEELATVNPCILSIDGGGIKGRVALEFLCALQEELGSDVPLQTCFDLFVGTSSGSSAPRRTWLF
jgi:hypothetical protein